MKYFFFIIFLSIISSCGTFNSWNGQLRFVKVDNQEIAVLEKTPQSEFATSVYLNPADLAEKTTNTEIAPVIIVGQNQQPQLIQKKENAVIQKSKNQKIAVKELDTDDDVASQAYRAERDANIAMGFSIAALLFGIIPFIVGVTFYFKALSSRYITPLGDNRLKISKVFLIFETVVFALEILFVTVLILLLL